MILFKNSCFFQKALFSGLFLIFSGCGMPRPVTHPMDDARAMAMAVKIQQENRSITSCKGTGDLIIKNEGQQIRYRAAWAAELPNRLRITFLSSGFPIETVIATGENVTFISHTGRHGEHRISEPDPDLKSILQIPIKLSMVVRMLTGHQALLPFDDAYFQQNNTSNRTLLLRNSKTNQVQQLETDTKGNLKIIRQLDYTGTPLFSVVIFEYQLFEKNRIPSFLNITAAPGKSMDLQIHSFAANPILKEELFQLTGTGS